MRVYDCTRLPNSPDKCCAHCRQCRPSLRNQSTKLRYMPTLVFGFTCVKGCVFLSHIVLPDASCLSVALTFVFLPRCNAALCRPASRRQLEAELCHREPVLLPRGRGSGPLHQWGLPHGGRHSGDVQAEVQRARRVKEPEWVRLSIKNIYSGRNYLTASQAIILFSSEKLLFVLNHKNVDLLLEKWSYSVLPEIISYCMYSVSIDANGWMHL